MDSMIEIAIQNAKYHGIDLILGTRNPAQGDCIFESVIDNINLRNCFKEKLSEDPSYWRHVWLNEIETIGFDYWNLGRTKEEWKTEFNLLKQPGVYEMPLFDLVPPGIAHCVRKNLLIFNTSPRAHCPIYVVTATMFGGNTDSEVPICLAYNNSHYESLIPCSDKDIEKTVLLSRQVSKPQNLQKFNYCVKVLSGEYNLKIQDIPLFNSEEQENASQKAKCDECLSTPQPSNVSF